MLKRIFSIFAIALIITGLFFEGYSLNCPVYADDTTDGWMDVTTNEQLVEAFRYYCKSRDLTIEGSVADAVTTFTTNKFNDICNTLGIDITALQAELKYETDGNSRYRFLFSSLGIDTYNRIFAQFLQDNDLSVGDTDVNKEVYSGKWFEDDNGYKCFITYINTTDSYVREPSLVDMGTPYRFDSASYFNSTSGNDYASYNLNYKEITYDYYINWNHNTSNPQLKFAIESGTGKGNFIYMLKSKTNNTVLYNGDVLIIENNAHELYLGYWRRYVETSGDLSNYIVSGNLKISSDSTDIPTTNIYLNSTTINNNNYEGDTIINNNGTPYDPDDPDPDDPDPDDPDPDDPTPDPPTIPDSGGWQDFSLPEMPNDWLIYGMDKKFPFDIPFNILFALSLLNHEPEIPKFEGDIDLQVCTWHYDIDLTPFDDIAKILRKFEVLAFIIGLAILTKELIMWG